MTEPSTSVAARLRLWLADPEVIADPYQLHAERVWTAADDVVTGIGIREGRPVVVAWDDYTWTAIPAWDDENLNWLWLSPVEDHPVPEPSDSVAGQSSASEVAELVGICVELQRRHRRLARQVLLELGPAAALLTEQTLTPLLQLARQPRLIGRRPGHGEAE